jgi:hypothetical protein
MAMGEEKGTGVISGIDPRPLFFAASSWLAGAIGEEKVSGLDQARVRPL